MSLKPNLYIIAGCNGAGKTTASFSILPEMLDCQEFINADEIARGLSPFHPEKANIDAGRIMLKRIKSLINQKSDFAFETTLSSKSYSNYVINAQANGYIVNLLFFWLNSLQLAFDRVNMRVQAGGHFIPNDVIVRRYKAGLYNLKNIYIPICDNWMIIDNSNTPSQLIAKGIKNNFVTIFNHNIFNKINSYE